MADDAAFLSPEWLDLQREVFAGLPQHGGESARVQYTVTGAPEGEAAYWVVYEDGRLTQFIDYGDRDQALEAAGLEE